MPMTFLLNIVDHLQCLVINGGKGSWLIQGKTIHLSSNNAKTRFQQLNQWQEYLARDSQTRNQQKMRHLPITENLKIHATKNKRGQRYNFFLI